MYTLRSVRRDLLTLEHIKVQRSFNNVNSSINTTPGYLLTIVGAEGSTLYICGGLISLRALSRNGLKDACKYFDAGSDEYFYFLYFSVIVICNTLTMDRNGHMSFSIMYTQFQSKTFWRILKQLPVDQASLTDSSQSNWHRNWPCALAFT